MMFSYLRSKKAISEVKPLTLARMSLELNFVNHALPSAGVSGISYMTWRLGHYGVSPGRAATSQVVRYVMGFVAFVSLLILAVAEMTIDGAINRWVVLISLFIVAVMVVGTSAAVFLVSNTKRISNFASWVTGRVNTVVSVVTKKRTTEVLKERAVMNFLDEIHRDFLELRSDKRILRGPYLWGLAFTIFDVMLFAITFWAFGSGVNPAPLLIAYGLASMAGAVLFTPGGAGAYEAIMIGFLAIAGVKSDVAIAGIILTRVILLLGTIGLGYVFYQHAILRYGKSSS